MCWRNGGKFSECRTFVTPIATTKVRFPTRALGEDLRDDLSGNVRQTEIATLEFVSQLPMVDAEEMEDRRVEIVDVHDVRDGSVAQFVGRAVADASFDASARHPHRESLDVMIAPAPLDRKSTRL